eukprot:CAMPEP_0184751186 /NCGR_PEP_ID=MMETSP0315-20130426/41216_1 /TAXON_ID=101924 /ORGANISM="Rhodosorus marinus, Strain UTEX LB 2760" /LENGTH=41 /DNA_ID= /DNA_START= /DNA_END= /DNA_ORIENTATION=
MVCSRCRFCAQSASKGLEGARRSEGVDPVDNAKDYWTSSTI